MINLKLNIVLVEPEIPANTGNISRTCSIVGASLHLVHPLGFDIDDKHLKRAGLDYWDELDLHYYDGFDEVLSKNPAGVFFYCTTKAKNIYSDVNFNIDGDVFLVFGKETKGLPEELLKRNIDRCIRIPMKEGKRSLNLSNSAAVIAFEALRQNGFENLQTEGKLI